MWAEEALAGTPYAAEVARLVRLTETHDPADDDLAGQALCDADLAILAVGAAALRRVRRRRAPRLRPRLRHRLRGRPGGGAARPGAAATGCSARRTPASGGSRSARPTCSASSTGSRASGVEAERMAGRVEHHPDVVLRLVVGHRRAQLDGVRDRGLEIGRPRPRGAAACPGLPGSGGQTGGS